MKPIPLTRRNHFKHITHALESLGGDPDLIVNRAGLPMWHHGDPEDLIPLRDVFRFIEKASHVVGVDRFGLVVGECNTIDRFGTFGQIICRSVSTWDAIQTACRLIKFHTPVTSFWLEHAGETIWFCRSQSVEMDVGRRQHEQYIVREMVRVVQLTIGPEWSPTEIAVRAPDLGRLEETDTFANSRFRYTSPHTAIAISRSLLSQRTGHNTASPERSIEEQLCATAPAVDFAGSLRQIIGSLLYEGHPDVHEAADIAGLHVRGLQRRLAEDGLTYRALVDQARYLAAIRFLEDTGIPLDEIANYLGYANSPAFIRSFRRWSGVTPGEYRRQRLEKS